MSNDTTATILISLDIAHENSTKHSHVNYRRSRLKKLTLLNDVFYHILNDISIYIYIYICGEISYMIALVSKMI